MEIGLRDYFAGQALAGLLATQDASWNDEIGEPAAMWRKGVTNGCYKLADAMLAARGEPKPVAAPKEAPDATP